MCGGIDDAERDARRRIWRYVEYSRTCAASLRDRMGQTAKERTGTRTFSAVPSSRRSKEHDAAMIAALLSDVV